MSVCTLCTGIQYQTADTQFSGNLFETCNQCMTNSLRPMPIIGDKIVYVKFQTIVGILVPAINSKPQHYIAFNRQYHARIR